MAESAVNMFNVVNNSVNFLGSKNTERPRQTRSSRPSTRPDATLRGVSRYNPNKRTQDSDSFEMTRAQKLRAQEKARNNAKLKLAAYSAAALVALGGLSWGVSRANETNNAPEYDITLPSDSFVVTDPTEEYPDFIITEPTTEATEPATEAETQHKISVDEMISYVQSDPYLMKSTYDIISTIQSMESEIDNPIGTINSILEQDFVDNQDLELILAQIFVESSGNHYDEDGSVLSSYANCNGYMQISEGVEGDINRIYYPDEDLSRDNPIHNLKLGIGYNDWLKENYFEDDLTKIMIAYNAGAGSVINGTYGDGPAEYANNILTTYYNLKENPELFDMILSGELDEHKNEFAYDMNDPTYQFPMLY